MTNVLLVIGSARKGRVADSVHQLLAEEIRKREDITTSVADLKELDIPFFDSQLSPSQEGYAITNENVKKWQELVTAADAVLFLTSENNHSMTAIQKNAIDWFYKEWNDKPVSATGYGWSGGSLAIENFDRVMGNLKADVRTHSLLTFMKDLAPDGSVIDPASVATQINTQLDALLS